MFSLLRRHLLFATLGSVFGAIAFFVFILTTANVLRDLLTHLLDGRITPLLFLKLTGFIVPYAVSFALPMGMLLGILLVLGRLSADNEILAMRASGLSLGQICRPLFALAAVGMALELGINYYFMPKARIAFHQEFEQALSSTALDFIKPKTFVRGAIKDTVVFAEEKEGDVLRDFWLWQVDPQGRVIRILHANEARLRFDAANASVRLDLQGLRVENRNAKKPEDTLEAPFIATSGSASFEIDRDSILGRATPRRKMDWMTLDQLIALRRKLIAENAPLADVRKVELTLSNKATSAVAVLAFTVLAIPLGIRTQRKETSANLALAVVLVLGYYVLSTSFASLDRFPHLHPELWVWIPNVLFLVAGVTLFRRVDRV